jgi:MoaA/NifB/PqqE/SkfB family radical SAM enzyme
MTHPLLRYYRGARQAVRANFARLATPFKLTIAVTYWCQYRCETCNIWQRRPTDELDTTELLAFVARNRDASWVDVTGGEIFLRPAIEEVLAAMLRCWPNLLVLHFPTNGFQTDRIVATVRRLASRAPARLIVTVSVDGAEPINDAIRGVSGGYRRQIETFRAIRAIPGARAFLGMTISHRNVGTFESAFRAWQRDCPGLRPDDVHLNVMQLSSHFYGNDQAGGLIPAPGEALADIRRYRLMRGPSLAPSMWLETQYLDRLEAFLETGRIPMRCHALRSTCFIDPWGTVFPCITYARPLGNLRSTGMRLEPLWRNEETKRLQREIWEGDCPQCWTACEAYPSILGNALRLQGHAGPPPYPSRTCIQI